MRRVTLLSGTKEIVGSICLLLAVVLFPGTSLCQQSLSNGLRPGDAIQLRLVVPGDRGTGQDYSGDYMVDETGQISLPLLGTIYAVNVPPQELRNRIIGGYQSLFHNQTVQVTFMRRISVLGAVRNPGIYHADPTMRIGDVIALAGGVTPQGRQDDVKIIRDGREVNTDLTILSSLPSELRSGDQVFVPEKSWVSRNIPWLIGVTVGIVGIIVRRY